MKDFIIGWILGNHISKLNESHPSTTDTSVLEDNIIETKKEKDIIVYEYWPEFDNDIPVLDMAYKLYEENKVCHIIKNGTCKCYFEFDGDTGYLKKDPKKYFEII